MLAKTPFTAQDVPSIKKELDPWLYDQVGGIVQSGPFKGMRLLAETAWRDAFLSPMLLGCYEEELHGILRQQVERLKALGRPPVVVVVGCAEGYYAIGLKRLLPEAKVYALDTDDAALDIMVRAAKVNNVEVVVGAPMSEVFAAPDFVLTDCEGAEIMYLDLNVWPVLGSAHILAEMHNYKEQRTDTIILDRFKGTHRIDLVLEGPRNPNQYAWLLQLPSDYRWCAVNEGRPCVMGWFSMTPRGQALC